MLLICTEKNYSENENEKNTNIDEVMETIHGFKNSHIILNKYA